MNSVKTSNGPFAIRGALEGFYGTFYSFAQRNDLIAFLGQHNFNAYLYGPKNDRHHRRNWREPYPAWHMEQFANTVAVSREAGVAFVYALSPGATISYHAVEDFAYLTDKLRAFYDISVRDFSLFLDDIDPQFSDSADSAYYESYAAAQADLCNRTLNWLQKLDPSCTLSMCPTDYHGSAPFGDYLHELGAVLDAEIGVFYTGPQICSTTITSEDARSFGLAVQRPPLIWDNYPVNDLAMQPELHIGPIRGREATLHNAVAGVYANLMSQPAASKVALHTFAAYFRDPAAYDPDDAWEAALQEVAGEQSAAALHLLAENSLRCCLRTPEAEPLTTLAEAAVQAVRQGKVTAEPFQALDNYLQQVGDACYHLSYAMDNAALRQDILPWTEGLHLQQEMGRHALAVLAATEKPQVAPLSTLPEVRRLKELIEVSTNHPKRIGGQALLPLAQEALQRAATLDAREDQRKATPGNGPRA